MDVQNAKNATNIAKWALYMTKKLIWPALPAANATNPNVKGSS